MSGKAGEEREGLWERFKDRISKFFSGRKLAKMDEEELMMLDGRLLDAVRKLLAECSLKVTRIANLAIRKRSRELWAKIDTSIMTYLQKLIAEAEAIPSGHAPVFEEKGFMKKYRYDKVIKPHKAVLTKAVAIDLLLMSEVEALSSSLSDLEKSLILDADSAMPILTKISYDLMRISDMMIKRKEMALKPVNAATIYRSLKDEYAWFFNNLLKHLMKDDIAELESSIRSIMGGGASVGVDKVLFEHLSKTVLDVGREASKAYGGLLSLPDLYVRLQEEGVSIGPQELSSVIKGLSDLGLVKLREENGVIYVDFLLDLAEDKLKVIDMFREKGLKKVTLSEAANILGWTIERVKQVMMALEKDGIVGRTESFMEEPCFYLKTPPT